MATIGIRRETKSPWERRVAVIPPLAGELVEAGHRVLVERCSRRVFPEADYADSAEGALRDADAAVLATDWPEFADLDWSVMARSVLVDGRHVDVDRDALDVYEGLCW